MKELRVGKNIIAFRKAKGITQDELAKYIGVSKASVSKWETGQSYPDITFLPLLATYFNVSVDELLGYSPQLTKKEIYRLYEQLSEKFATNDYEEVYQEIEQLIRKYYSCVDLLFKMGVLLLNYSITANEPLKQKMQDKVEELMIRIQEEDEDWYSIKQASVMQATLYLVQGRAVDVIDSIEDKVRPYLGEEEMLVQAYSMNGNQEKSIQTLQFCMYQNSIALIEELASYLMLKVNDLAVFDETVARGMTVIESFKLKDINGNNPSRFYYSAAAGYLMQGRKEQCYDMLERFVACFESLITSFVIKQDEYFDQLEQAMEAFDLMSSAPRNRKTVVESTIKDVEQNPVFASIKDEAKFQLYIKRMKEMLVS